MFHVSRRSAALPLMSLLVAALAFAAAQSRAPQNGSDKGKEEPPFHEYKGVHIGMTADEARKLFAVSVTYLGGGSVPVPKSVLGTDIEAKQDGSLYKLIRFPKAGYWVSYTRTSGDSPMTIIVMQKIQ